MHIWKGSGGKMEKWQNFKAHGGIIKKMLSAPKYLAAFVLLFICLEAVYAVATDMLLPDWKINPLLKVHEAILISAIAALAALSLLLIAYGRECANYAKNASIAGVGGLLGLFATACPVCQPAWLLWLGLGGATVFLVQASLFIELISIALLLVSIYYTLEAIRNPKCKIRKRKN
jgi:hypothetical protein